MEQENLKEIIDKIIEKDDEQEMRGLGLVLLSSLNELKKHDEKLYKDFSGDICFYAYGKHLSKITAIEWVFKMENNDGTVGEHWTKAETDNAAKTVNIDFSKTNYNEWEWYAVMNMIYSDYYSPEREAKDYIYLAKKFIEDKDAVEGKTYYYYKYIVNK